MIANTSENEGVCLEGRWKGWLFRKHPDGQWVSVRKLDEADPFEANPWVALINSTAPKRTNSQG